ncbi:MAG: amidase [Thermomicrobiales bacterium]
MTIDTLTGALDALNARTISTLELVDSLLERLERTEPTLHTYVSIFTESARAQASAADRWRRIGTDVPPLLGIPIGVKDIFDIAGDPTRCNSRLREHVAPATTDSDAVAALKRDGAIILGKTVTQEFAAGVVSAPARNAWDPDRIPGGSSGGSAASIAAGTCLGALGSDTGGSIRIPASLNDVVGFKPTFGQLSTAGVYPLSTSLDTVGPIARTVLDAVILYQSLRNEPDAIASSKDTLDRQGSLRGKRIGVFSTYFDHQLQPGVASAFATAVAHLQAEGAEIVSCDWSDAPAARAAGLLISRIESAALHEKTLLTQPELMGEDLRSRLEVGALLPASTYIEALRVRDSVTRSIADVFIGNRLDAVVAPSTPASAPRVDASVVTFPDGAEEAFATAMTRFTTPWNSTGQPVFSVPCGFDELGLPVGLSFIGRPHADLALASIAHAYEQSTDWHTKRPAN